MAAQAQKKNPNYAPISNTTGLIQVQLKNFNGAVKSFGKARQLDPTFFEAQMNYAAVNLSFRGYEEAEKAYRDALKLHPKDYEAQLGLALAVRGQINDSNFDKNVAEAQAHLDEAKKIAPDRPETYYNEAILTQEFRAKRGNAVPALQKAADQYKQFIDKAGSDPSFAAAVKRSKDRSQDIADSVKFIQEGEQAAKDAANQPPPPPPPADGAAPPADGSAAPPADGKGAPPADGKGATPPADAKDAPAADAKGAAPPADAKPADKKPRRQEVIEDDCFLELRKGGGVPMQRTPPRLFALTHRRLRSYNLAVISRDKSEETEMALKRSQVVAISIGVAAFVLSSAALAQDAKAGGDKPDGYGYEFSDDPLNAGGFGPNDATIKVRPRAARTTLIRPRTTFVPEMLKSVENI